MNTGSIRIHPYDGTKEGWFPVESFGFGFIEKPKDGSQAGAAGSAHGAPGKPSAPAPTASVPGKGGKPQDFAEVTLEKQVDMVTGSLMALAMQERKSKKGTGQNQEQELHVDVHFVSAVTIEKLEAGRFTYTSLMVHLEAVNIQNWQIRGSGDSRPTESVTLRFDRAAMVYVGTGDGKNFQVDTARGWDQTKNDNFTWNLSNMKKYFPAGMYVPGATIKS